MSLLANFVKFHQFRWMPFLVLLLSLFGILFLNWQYQQIIILFVWEIFLMLSFALLKMFFARNDLPFYETIIQKIIFLFFGIFIGILFLVFSVMFVSKSIQTDVIFKQIRTIDYQIYVMTIGYFIGFFINYIGNKKYKEAIPMMQMAPFIHVLTILAILQAFTGHLLPSYPSLDQAVWGIVALVVVKFFVDLLFRFFQG